MNTYNLHTIQDLLKVPAERRADCLKEIELLLSLYELAFGEHAATAKITDFAWTDDGDKSIEICNADGSPFLALEVTKS